MITLPWNLSTERVELFWLVKVQLEGTPAPPPLLLTTGTNAVSVDGDVYNPDVLPQMLTLTGVWRPDSSISRNPVDLVALDDANWTWRKRIEANTFQQARLTVRMASSASKHVLLRAAQGTGWTATVGDQGRMVSMTFAELLTSNGDKRIRIVDQDVQRKYDAADTSFAHSDVPFTGTWGYKDPK